MAHWIKLIYDRNTYVIDLDRIGAFCHTPNGRITFSIMDGNTTIVVTQQADPITYKAILEYVEMQTGLSLLGVKS